MDKFWSICAFPIGLAICFGPALLVWLKLELESEPGKGSEDSKNRRQ